MGRCGCCACPDRGRASRRAGTRPLGRARQRARRAEDPPAGLPWSKGCRHLRRLALRPWSEFQEARSERSLSGRGAERRPEGVAEHHGRASGQPGLAAGVSAMSAMSIAVVANANAAAGEMALQSSPAVTLAAKFPRLWRVASSPNAEPHEGEGERREAGGGGVGRRQGHRRRAWRRRPAHRRHLRSGQGVGLVSEQNCGVSVSRTAGCALVVGRVQLLGDQRGGRLGQLSQRGGHEAQPAQRSSSAR